MDSKKWPRLSPGILGIAVSGLFMTTYRSNSEPFSDFSLCPRSLWNFFNEIVFLIEVQPHTQTAMGSGLL